LFDDPSTNSERKRSPAAAEAGEAATGARTDTNRNKIGSEARLLTFILRVVVGFATGTWNASGGCSPLPLML
jgi:hypothetical protein